MQAAPSRSAPPVMGASPFWAGRSLRWAGVAAVLVVGVVLWRVEPAGQFYYPRCWTYAVTGLKCPGCGVLRATHALLRGEWALAWTLNPLWVCYLPVIAWSGASWMAGGFGRKISNPLRNQWILGVLGGLAVAYGIARNLPGLAWLG